jgi:DNA-3-methyladenine glycosylase II
MQQIHDFMNIAENKRKGTDKNDGRFEVYLFHFVFRYHKLGTINSVITFIMTSWSLKSEPPHDWFICLDIDPYFDHEHHPEEIIDHGFTKPIPLAQKDILVTTFFNGDTEKPEFHFECPESLTDQEIKEANEVLTRIFGLNLDLRPFYEQAGKDPVLGPLLMEYYGMKRMSRATLFDDIVNRIIQMRLSHKPTAKKMVFKVRERYGAHLVHQGQSIPAWPRPYQLTKADPAQIRKLGPTLRKGEYITGLAQDILSGNIDLNWLDIEADPLSFYDTISNVRGVGPTSAQDLMLFRPRTDAVFPAHKIKGQEKGLRRWIIMSYGGNPDQTSENQFKEMIENWKGFEAAAIEFLFVNWIITRKEK